MKRRKFLLTSGSTILTGTAISSFQRSAIGLEFDLSAIPDEKPSNINSVFIKFTNFKITPQYLDENSKLDIAVELDIEGERPFTKQANNISFSNGEIITDTKIKDRTGTDLSSIVLDNLDKSGDDLQGEVTITANHPDINQKSYKQSFTIDKDTVLVSEKRIGTIEDFKDNDLVEYGGDKGNFTTQTNITESGTYALRSNSSGGEIYSKAGLPRYPQAGDTFEWQTKNNTNGSPAHQFLFGYHDQENHYWIEQIDDSSISYGFRLNKSEAGSFTQLDSSSTTSPRGSWYTTEVTWGEGGLITVTMFDGSGNKLDELSATDASFIRGGIGFYYRDRSASELGYYDNVGITDTSPSTGIIEDFEDGDLSEYSVDEQGESVTVQSNTVIEGNDTLEISHTSGTSSNSPQAYSNSELDVYPQAGDTFSYKFQLESPTEKNSVYTSFGWADQSGTRTGYFVQIQQDSGGQVIRLIKSGVGDLATDSISFSTGVVYTVEVDWSEDGTMQVTLSDANGTITTITGSDTDYTGGGVSWFLTIGNNPEWQAYYDIAEIISSGDRLQKGIIDDFEDNDLSEYSGALSDWSIQTGTAYDGTYAVQHQTNSTSDIFSTSGLPRYPNPGDTFEYYTNVDGFTGFFFGVQDSNNYYYYAVNYNQQRIRIYKNSSGSLNQIASKSVSISENTWYRVKGKWAADGRLIMELYDTNQNQIDSISTTDNEYGGGGIGLRANESDEFDRIKLI